jgi:hypothetical protein
MQKAGRLDDAAAVRLGGPEYRLDELIHHLAKPGHAGILGFGKTAGLDQGVAVA